MKHKNKPTTKITVFILSMKSERKLFDRLTEDIEKMDGIVKHAYPPRVMIAEVPALFIERLKLDVRIQFLTDAEIPDGSFPMREEELQGYSRLWNDFLSNRKTSVRKDRENIPWDAPGFLPPDPPPGIREMVQEWEKKMNESDGNG